MSSLLIWFVGFLFCFIGIWIISLRFEGVIDWFKPHSILIGNIMVDGKQSKAHAELLRVRFDHHFRRPVAIPQEAGFIEVLTLDSPSLFQQEKPSKPLENMTLEVSGVNVGYLLQLIYNIVKPDQWIIEGDFHVKSDGAMLALRMRRGQRPIRTWYIERQGDLANKNLLLEQLIDDAIFQLAFDFGNSADENEDLKKWREVIPTPAKFPSRSALAAYYKGRGALERYYAHGEWLDLDNALIHLRTLRAHMPKYSVGLQLLAMALAEKRNEDEAIHVYEQLLLLLQPNDIDWDHLSPDKKRHIASIELLKATATTKLSTWQSTHMAIASLKQLEAKLEKLTQTCSQNNNLDNTCSAFQELYAQTTVQIANAYALYLSYIRYHTIAEMFDQSDAPTELKITDQQTLKTLKDINKATESKEIVIGVIKEVIRIFKEWIKKAEQKKLNIESDWSDLNDSARRKTEFIARMNLSLGYVHYRMAELENSELKAKQSLFNKSYEQLLESAADELRKAEAAHPNHYQVLQLLGQVYAEPRRKDGNLTIAEQYFSRAIQSNPSDYYSYALLAKTLLRRASKMGINEGSRTIIEKGLEASKHAVLHKETDGNAQLIKSQLLLALLEIEREEKKRKEYQHNLSQSIEQAARFLPQAFSNPNVDLSWVKIISSTHELSSKLRATNTEKNAKNKIRTQFPTLKKELVNKIDLLLKNCKTIEERWVAHQRIAHIKSLISRANKLKTDIEKASLESWHDIQVEIL